MGQAKDADKDGEEMKPKENVFNRYEQLPLFDLNLPIYFYKKWRVEVTGLSINGNRTFIKFPDGATACVDSRKIDICHSRRSLEMIDD